MATRSVSRFLALALFYAATANAGCPAMVVTDVTLKLESCQPVAAPAGLLIRAGSRVSKSMFDLQVKQNENLTLFIEGDNRLTCKDLPAQGNLCMNIQRWCAMAGSGPHGAGLTGSGVRKGACAGP